MLIQLKLNSAQIISKSDARITRLSLSLPKRETQKHLERKKRKKRKRLKKINFLSLMPEETLSWLMLILKTLLSFISRHLPTLLIQLLR